MRVGVVERDIRPYEPAVLVTCHAGVQRKGVHQQQAAAMLGGWVLDHARFCWAAAVGDRDPHGS
jgi:hypothetical protein